VFAKHLMTSSVSVLISVIFALSPKVTAQGQDRERVLVIEGGTIIDGTGSAPRADIRIVIRNGRIQEIGPRNQVRRPDEASVIDAQGKFIIPGLIDSHVHLFGYEGELYLNHGVTTVMSLSGIPEWDRAQGEAIARGDVVGPRIFTAGNPLVIPPGGMPHWIPVNNREEAIRGVRKQLEFGVDYVKIHRIARSEVAKVIIDQAHLAGKRVVAHLDSNFNFDAREAAIAGVDMLAHATGIVPALIKDPELKKQAEHVPTLAVIGPASLMQRELYADLINLLTKEDVYLEPDLILASKGIHPLSAKFLLEDADLLSDVGLIYVSDNSFRRWFRFQNFANSRDQKTRKILEKGYENFVLFLRQFVEAGGKLLVGSDAEGTIIPGISLHHELELLVHEGILSPMQAIVSATRLPAEFLGRNEDLGTLEKGKIADLVILRRNPLQDISSSRDIFAVLKEGTRVDLTYHRYFTNPLPRPWLAGAKGTGFLPSSFVRVNGVGQDIEFVGRGEIRTTLNCKSLNVPGTPSLVVVNPTPINEDDSPVSNVVKFVVTK